MWPAVLLFALLLVSAGMRRSGIIILCISSALVGASIEQSSGQLQSSDTSVSGVWYCIVETTTSDGALLETSTGYTAWSSNRRLAASVSRGDSVVIIGSINGAFMQSSVFRAIPSALPQDIIRRHIAGHIADLIPSRKTSSLVSALLIGERGNLPTSVRGIFRDTGTTHLLALSGLHVGILSTLSLLLFRKLFGKGWLSVIAVIFSMLLYVFISGARPSALRAGVMLLMILILMHSSGRTPDLIFIWSIAAIILIAASGGEVLNDVGAQMSFCAVLSLILLGRRFEGKAGLVLSIAYAGVIVTIALAPLVSITYGGLSPVAPIATVISLPFMLGTIITGTSALILPAGAFSVLCEWIVFLWLAVLGFLRSGRIVFLEWMFWLWPLCLIALWIFSRRNGFLRRFR